jgi:hypothetical protein
MLARSARATINSNAPVRICICAPDRSVLGQENASDVLAGIAIDHHEINLAYRPFEHLIETVRIKLLVNQNGSRVDGGSDEFKPDRLFSALWHTCSPAELAASMRFAERIRLG